MNPHNPGGWPLGAAPGPPPTSEQPPLQQRPPRTFEPALPMQQGPQHQLNGPAVMPQPAGYYTGQQQHRLPTPSNLPPHASPMQSARGPPPHAQQQSPTSLPPPPSQSHYGLPALGPSLPQQSSQAVTQTERELLEREQRERMRQEQLQQEIAQQRYEQEAELLNQQREHERQAREMQAQHQREQHRSPRENHAGAIPLQQPVASRVPATLHGPNGILSEQHLAAPSHPQPSQPLGAPSGPGNVFGFGSAPPANENLRPLQQQANHNVPPQQHLLNMTSAVAQQQPNGVGAISQGQQPILNDALSYLDQVKVRFQEQPDVYNRFLDIMKDFKSQAIDTPGVIDRVSTLFAGHPELIQGFNTFLPPGYKIECGLNDDPNSIRVTTPMGTTVQQIPPPGRAGANAPVVDGGRPAYYPESSQNGEWTARQQEIEREAVVAGGRPGMAVFSGQPQATGEASVAYDDPVQLENQADSIASGLSSSQQLLGLEKRGPVEFNHAIGYVNKIKNRFASQPEIYKQFLEILQTYQRESKPIQDVYAQVTQLFSSAQDLLEDFKQFLPETAGQAKAQAQAAAKQAEDATMLSNVRNEAGYSASTLHNQVTTPRPELKMPPVGSFAPPSVGKDGKKRRGGAGSQIAGASTGAMDSNAVANSKNRGALGNANKRARLDQTKPSISDTVLVSPTLVPSLPTPLPPAREQSAMSEGITFFERVKKHLSNRSAFNEFLKLCNLFNQGIIDKDILVQKTHNFIGSNTDLMNWFKKWVKFDGKDTYIENEAMIPNGKVVLSNCRGLGPSYRLLPKRERLRTCTGRDELCRLVLNDEWVSHPTWASEESGFIAHRKNSFEEALHRIEEERHDYDINIEACLRTIQLLEPIAQQIKMMNEDEKFSYKLSPGIGGQSETIYQRVIKKIYDRERGNKVIEDMFRRPSSVVPVLLGRLKQKAEEWKASQREWEKVWREQTNRIFWKSLDHQGINVKIQDKRQFQPKTLHTEIHTKYEEQRRQRMATPWANIPKYQFEYQFNDIDVIYDCCHLILTDLHYAYTGNEVDKTRLDTFIKTFVPTFFDIDRELFEEKMNDIEDTTPPNEEAEDENNMDTEFPARGRRGGAGKKQNLLRGVLEKSSRGQKEEGAEESGASTPDVQSNDEEGPASTGTPTDQPRVDPAEHRWMSYPSSGNEADLNVPFKRDDFHLYATSNIYCFFRMFQGLYERLLNIKNYEAQVHEDVSRAKVDKPANELGLTDKQPTDYFADVSPSANYYRQVMQMCEDVVKSEMDQTHLEETLRRFYMHDGWQLYSFERMLSAILRFALQILVSDNKDKSLDIINLFYKDRREDETTHSNELTYRKQVEKFGKDGDIFRIRYHRPTRSAYVQIFKKDDKTYESDELAATARWSYYVSTYSMFDHTEGVPYSVIRAPFLRRNMPFSLGGKDSDSQRDEQQSFSVPMYNQDGLVIRISPNNYHILYDPYTSDWWIQSSEFRQRGLSGYKEAKEERDKGVRDLFENKERNAWMRTMSEAEVEQTKRNFERWMKDGPDALGNDTAADAAPGKKSGNADVAQESNEGAGKEKAKETADGQGDAVMTGT